MLDTWSSGGGSRIGWLFFHTRRVFLLEKTNPAREPLLFPPFAPRRDMARSSAVGSVGTSAVDSA